jgi:D-alanyl-D-alanine carboxypeptidase/D-alanyl-D-alanine-endopeptidase (penicillin-binding protein 4)
MWDEGSQWYFAQVDALTLNDNCVDLIVRPGPEGEPPEVRVHPNTDYVTISNQARTVPPDTGITAEDLEIERRWWERSNVIDITGRLPSNAEEQVYYRTVENPARFTGVVFREYLRRYGVAVTGPVVLDTLRRASAPVAVYRSPALTHSLIHFLKTSDNLTGELLVKTMGYVTAGPPGTWDKGLRAIRIFLQKEVGIDTTTLKIADGSGVSRYNLTSPEQLVRLLTYMYHDPTVNSEYQTALPTGGWDGTLKRRMRSEELNRRIRAKTGTLDGVSCLSGYLFPRRGDPLAFAIMMNGYVGDAAPYRQLQDDICAALVNLRQ